MCYDLVWNETFEEAEVLIRSNRLTLGGGTRAVFPTAWYRWWIADVKPDGSAFKRHTLFCGRLNPGKDRNDGGLPPPQSNQHRPPPGLAVRASDERGSAPRSAAALVRRLGVPTLRY